MNRPVLVATLSLTLLAACGCKVRPSAAYFFSASSACSSFRIFGAIT